MMVDIVLFPTVHDMGGLMWSCDDLKSCTVDPDFCCGQTHKSTKMLKKVLTDLVLQAFGVLLHCSNERQAKLLGCDPNT